MAYVCDLSNGQQIYLDNVGEQTSIVCATVQSGQQQQSGSSFTTGVWTKPPQLFRTVQSFVIKLTTDRGETFIQIQGQSLQVTNQPTSMAQAQQMQVSPIATMPGQGSIPVMQPLEMTPMTPMPPITPMQPMQPMQPMRMGDMQMSMNPMQMQMGNMQMQMGKANPTQAATHRRFCPSCGNAVKPDDRFCSSCGNSLSV